MPAIRITNLRVKRRADGRVAYYWEVPSKDRARGCPLINEALGTELPAAVGRAQTLNAQLTAWRRGEDGGRAIKPGSVAWLFRAVEKHPRFTKTAPATQRAYLQGFRLIEAFVTKAGFQFGEAPAKDVKERHVDRLYEALQWVEERDDQGRVTKRRRLATANAAMRAARRAWSIAKRAGWVDGNPFSTMGLEQTGGNTRPASRAEMERFVKKSDEMGRPSMGTAAMLAFELCQREGDVIGTISWTDYRPGIEIRVRQHKTGEMVWVPLSDEHGALFPGLITRMDATPRRGTLIVMRDVADRRRRAFLPYKVDHFRHLFREIADAAGLPKELTFMAFRHGGLTELGDAGATDQELMSHSGHRSRQTLSVYTRPSRQQALNAARKRRALRSAESG
ncbi:MAG: site-specific integrase [Alphaproteobacteria bacterium]|nr:site-specific integrase [Alphaproteobacteria bacterium]